ncbi:MAG TPA: dienelactone hydrolase family protein, partial [Methanoregula sp.]|nr:dienelactone hydrolase family protein [Methanoregula sp.]
GSTGTGSPAPTKMAPQDTPVPGSMITLTAGGKTYPAYFAAPQTFGKHPGIVLIHSFNGLEQGYKDMCDRIAGDGFVVIAPAWQTFNSRPGDTEVGAIIRSSANMLKSRPDVDSSRLGLTGFCAGGRYTMLFLPQVKDFRAGVAWYGFPYNPGFTNDTTPASHIAELSAPMLMIHGSRDQASPITDIFSYSQQLDAAGKYFELKEYQGQPHGFMIVNGDLNREDYAENAYGEMIAFFQRKL